MRKITLCLAALSLFLAAPATASKGGPWKPPKPLKGFADGHERFLKKGFADGHERFIPKGFADGHTMAGDD